MPVVTRGQPCLLRAPLLSGRVPSTLSSATPLHTPELREEEAPSLAGCVPLSLCSGTAGWRCLTPCCCQPTHHVRSLHSWLDSNEAHPPPIHPRNLLPPPQEPLTFFLQVWLRQAHLALSSLACEPSQPGWCPMHRSVKCIMVIATICQLPARYLTAIIFLSTPSRLSGSAPLSAFYCRGLPL